MTDADRAAALARYQQLTADGLRVVAVAYRTLPRRSSYGQSDETDLVLAGFLAFSDPILPDVGSIIAQLGADGVAVKILTGDSDAAARQPARRGRCASSRATIARMNDDALARRGGGVGVARVSPAQKSRIIRAQTPRHVVGFMGDGINDAPSLHGRCVSGDERDRSPAPRPT
jgi:Mg2+-importing ATPase